MASIAVAVLLLDLVSKEYATVLLASDSFAVNPPALGFSFFLTTNEGALGGLWLGEQTRLINIASMTLVVALIMFVARQVIAFYSAASIAFGLIAGAALGNTLSLLVAPGVTDFISLNSGSWSIAFNLADVALVAGVMVLAPITFSLAVRVRETRRVPMRTVDVSLPARTHDVVRRPVVYEREVPLAFASEVTKPAVEDAIVPSKKRTISDRPLLSDRPAARQDEASF